AARAAGRSGVIRPHHAGHAFERGGRQFHHQYARRIDRTRQLYLAARYFSETETAIIRLVADQQDDLLAGLPRRSERGLDQRHADTVRAERRLDGERTEQQGRRRADPDRRQPHRAHQQRADPRRERKRGLVRHALAQPVSAAREAAGAERALAQLLDRRRVFGLFWQDGENDIGQAWTPARTAPPTRR